MRPVHVLLLAACSEACGPAPCEPTTRIRPDTEMINGVSLEQADPLLRSATNAIPLRWLDGRETTLEAQVTPTLGTATLDQRYDCIEECGTGISLGLECGPDQISFKADFLVRTQDGRLDERHLGAVYALREASGAVVWNTYSEVPAVDLVGTASSAINAEGCEPGRDEAVQVWLYGQDDRLLAASVGFSALQDIGDIESLCSSGLGGTPRSE